MREIELMGKHGRGLVALVDDCDYQRVVDAGPWRAHKGNGNKTFYAQRNIRNPVTGKRTTQKMHRFVMGMEASDRREVDHENGNGLDNRRSENLRIATRSQNACNRSKRKGTISALKGVTPGASPGKWIAQIGLNGNNTYLGTFETEEEAHDAYCKASARIHGEFGSDGRASD